MLSVVGKVFCKILNNRLVQCLDKEGALHEGQAGFRINISCMDNVYTLNKIVTFAQMVGCNSGSIVI